MSTFTLYLHTNPSTWLLSRPNQPSLPPRRWLEPPIPPFLSLLPFQKGLSFLKLESGATTLVLEWHAKPPMVTKKMDCLFKGNSIGEICSLASEASTVQPIFTVTRLPWQLRFRRRTLHNVARQTCLPEQNQPIAAHQHPQRS